MLNAGTVLLFILKVGADQVSNFPWIKMNKRTVPAFNLRLHKPRLKHNINSLVVVYYVYVFVQAAVFAVYCPGYLFLE